MGFSNQERINANSKALQAGVIDANASAVWYETYFPFTFVLSGEQAWTEMASLRALTAANLTAAQANAAANPTLLQDKSAAANARRLTLVAGTNYSTYVAYSTYNDPTSTQLKNWVLPQLIPQSTGAPSNGYAIRLFDGDPNGGGTEITTTDGTTGTGENKTVGWIWNYANGLLLVSVDFFAETGITAADFDPYVLGFRYIGATASSTPAGQATSVTFTGTAGEALTAGDVVRLDASGGGTAGRVFKAQADSISNADVVGIVKTGASLGATVTVYTQGSVPVTFGSAPATASNGNRVFLDSATAGRATLTAPTSSGQSVVLMGNLIGANGALPSPNVILKITELAVLG